MYILKNLTVTHFSAFFPHHAKKKLGKNQTKPKQRSGMRWAGCDHTYGISPEFWVPPLSLSLPPPWHPHPYFLFLSCPSVKQELLHIYII